MPVDFSSRRLSPGARILWTKDYRYAGREPAGTSRLSLRAEYSTSIRSTSRRSKARSFPRRASFSISARSSLASCRCKATLIDIPADSGFAAEGTFEVIDGDPNGGGETTLTLRRIVHGEAVSASYPLTVRDAMLARVKTFPFFQ